MEYGRFPNRIQQYRRCAGLSRKKVARILGLNNTSMLSRWERGVSTPTIVQTFELCRLYKVLPHELYFEVWKQMHSDPTLAVNRHQLSAM